jgi:hypothetical protein
MVKRLVLALSIAFARRFHTTCWRRPGSPAIDPADGSSTALKPMLFASARPWTDSMADSITATRSTGPTSRRSLPATIPDSPGGRR